MSGMGVVAMSVVVMGYGRMVMVITVNHGYGNHECGNHECGRMDMIVMARHGCG